MLDLWAHAEEWWDACVLPDLGRIYSVDTSDDDALLAKPWRWLYNTVLSLFSVPGSMTAAGFHREET